MQEKKYIDKFKKRRRKKTRPIKIMLFVTLILCCVLWIHGRNLEKERDQYAKRYEMLELELAALEQDALEIEEERIYRTTKAFIIEEARNKFGLVLPNEIIIEPEN